jgi:hypothetical protein
LLISQGWHEDKAKEAFLSSEGTEDYFKFEFQSTKPDPNEVIWCEVCYEELPRKELLCIEVCGHGLCTTCYKDYLTAKLLEGTPAVEASCPDAMCKLVVPESIWRKALIDDHDKFERFRQFVFTSYVEISKSAKWCPGTSCDMVVELKRLDDDEIDVLCTECYATFCYKCSEAAH